MAGRKLFVGALPDNISESTLRATFSQYGQVEDVFVKPRCEPGRQIAFVTMATAAEANFVKESCDRTMTFPGCDRACEVMIARNQGLFGQPQDVSSALTSTAFADPRQAVAATMAAAGGVPGRVQALPPDADGPRKILVGSLPDKVPEEVVRAAFSPYGEILDVYVKQNCEPGRQWAFVTFATHHQAHNAKISTDRMLVLSGGTKACEVMFARPAGREAAMPVAATQPEFYLTQPMPVSAAAAATQLSKIFVGSMPGDVTESQLREEFEKYGTVMDAFVKPNCELGRQWGFVTYSTPEEAAVAKDATDRILLFPGADRACEVMIAKRKDPVGAQPLAGVGAVQYIYGAAPPAGALPAAYYPGGQPPPPSTPAPFDVHNTPWRCYYTKDGLPYYHHSQTGATQWERPRELPPLYGAAPVAGQRRGPY